MSADHRLEIEQRCHTRLHDLLSHLDLSGVATIEHLCQAVAAWRHRPIRLLPLVMPVGLTGLWIPGATEDYIAYAQNAPTPLAEHAVAHELSHVLCEHQARGHQISSSLLAVFTHLAPERVLSLLQGSRGRTAYDSDEEYEAEYFGSLLEQALTALRADDEGLSESEREMRTRLMRWTRELRGF